MERLHFDAGKPYSALESSIHLARYGLARSVCSGKAVLDAACGEGYGSYLLAEWGARSVDGVDIAEDAIAVARRTFAQQNVVYHTGDLVDLGRQFPKGRFDLVVSLETIEHIRDPKAFLKGLKAVAAKDATIIISCPNDHWYYTSEASNPFHVRKFRFAEFKKLTERVLGPATSWRMGSLAAGFGALRVDESVAAGSGDDQTAMLQARQVGSALVLPTEDGKHPTTENCSFFVGVWGPDIDDVSLAIYPLSMDESDRSLFGGPSLSETQGYVKQLEQRRDELETHLASREAAAADPDPAAERDAGAAARQRIERLERDLAASQADVKRREHEAGNSKAQITRLRDVIETLERGRDELQAQAATDQAALRTLERQRGEAQTQLEAQRAEIGRLEAHQGQLAAISTRQQEFIERIDARRGELEALLAQRERQVRELEGWRAGMEPRAAAQDEAIRTLQAEAAALGRDLEGRIAENQRLVTALRDRDASDREAGKALRATSLRLRAALAENAALRDRTRELRDRRDELEGQLGTQQSTIRALEGQLAGHQDIIRTLEQRLAKQEQALHEHLGSLRGTEERLVSAEGQLTTVPWRVVRIYWRIRPLLPKPVLRWTGALIRARRGFPS